jgi:histidinol-phosphate aminotransferase
MVKTDLADTLLYRKLMKRGIMVRTMTGFRFPDWIRVSFACRPVMEEFGRAFRSVLRPPGT